ncbi:MAG TPA: GNAT family N-acetyltransferase [Actinomycetes bacterium]|nr:GNAT family N-acetyltransferase [Actinomycetes bacterium]
MTELRPLRLPEDLEPLWRIAFEAEQAVHPDLVTTHEEVRTLLEGPGVDMREGVRVAVDDRGEVVGFVATEVDPPGREVRVDAYARPGSPTDLLALLLEHGVRYARGVAVARSAEPGWVCLGGAYVDDAAYVAALGAAGLAPVRRFHRMHLDLRTARPQAPVLPEGTTITVVGPDEAAQRELHEVLEEAFEGHWRHVRHPWPEWIAWVSNRGYDPTQWWLARVDGVPAGALLGDDTLAESDTAYVSMLGVLAPYRGRGLARALLLTAFEEARRRGRIALRLGVDTENGTGAPALYASVGMSAAQTVEAYELPLP